jgi:hypothetical protein
MSAEENMVDVSAALERERMLGYERLEAIHGTTYQDASTIIVVPTRGLIHQKVVSSWENMIPFMNQKKAKFYAVGDEVGVAYNKLMAMFLRDPVLSKWRYVLTLEDDNIIPPDAHVRLVESIELGPFAGVGGIYFTKGEVNLPMCYGNPHDYRNSGQLDFRPRDIVEGMKGGNIIECNGIAMGCTLWRLELFREIEPPWFVTVNDVVSLGAAECFTQDLYFCRKARQAGKRFAVDTRVRVGHIDVNTGEVY